MPWREPDDPSAWVDLNATEYDEVWDQIYAQLDFRPGVKPEDWPSFREPHDSVTYDLCGAFTDIERSELEAAAALLEALNVAKGSDRYVYALDWQHPGYRFYPGEARAPLRVDSWLVPALPDGDYYLFVADDLRLGWLSHPWESSVCVFGALVPAFRSAWTDAEWPILRSGGRPIRPSD